MSVTKFQQNVYNTYLAVSRSSQNKPFKLRQDFSDFHETEQFVLVSKLERIFNQHPEIKLQHYFKAPYALHPTEVFDLEFYTTLKAIKCYSMYMKTLDNLPYDDPYQLQQIKDSLKFVKNYCLQNNIPVNLYVRNSQNNIYPDWLIHLKDRHICPAIMFGFEQTRSVIENVDSDIVDMLISNFHNDYYSNLSKFNNSSKAKTLVKKGLALIDSRINI